jgi:hypothetical protein
LIRKITAVLSQLLLVLVLALLVLVLGLAYLAPYFARLEILSSACACSSTVSPSRIGDVAETMKMDH